MLIYLLHGPNLNMLGSREPSIYGTDTIETVEKSLSSYCEQNGAEFEAFWSNFEGEMIEKIHQIAKNLTPETQSNNKAGFEPNDNQKPDTQLKTEMPKNRAKNSVGVIINPGAWTHYSYALTDALAMLKEKGVTIIELHISNPHSRESFRRNSVISPNVSGVICGLGTKGYQLAAQHLLSKD